MVTYLLFNVKPEGDLGKIAKTHQKLAIFYIDNIPKCVYTEFTSKLILGSDKEIGHENRNGYQQVFPT